MGQNDRKGKAYIYYIIKQLLTYISAGMECYWTVDQYDVYCSITVHVHLNISKYLYNSLRSDSFEAYSSNKWENMLSCMTTLRYKRALKK